MRKFKVDMIFRFGLLAFAFLLSLLRAEIAQEDEKAPVALPEVLQVIGGESLQMGKMLDREQRDFSFRLRNGQDKALKLLRVRVNCPCLSLQEIPVELTLAPGEECQVKGRFDAGKVKTGEFDRVILVQVEGAELQLVSVIGESVQMLDFDPAPSIDLGTFAGVEVPWSRTIRIKSRFAGEQALELLPPPEHAHFEYKLEKLSPLEYQFTFTPKLPLPRGRLRHIVELPTRGIERYGAVQLGLFGTVTGWLLTLDSSTVLVDLKTAQPGENFVKEVKVIADSGAGRGGRRRQSNLAREKALADKLENVQLASEEEEVAGSLQKLPTWQKIAEELSIKAPDGMTVEKIPEADGIIIKISMSEDYFATRRRTIIPIEYQKNSISRLTVVGRK